MNERYSTDQVDTTRILPRTDGHDWSFTNDAITQSSSAKKTRAHKHTFEHTSDVSHIQFKLQLSCNMKFNSYFL